MQPADVGWFKELKLLYRNDWNDWFINGEKKFTKYGNLAGPGYKNMTRWLLKGWEEFNAAKIISSFSYCGITSDTDQDYHSTLRELLNCTALPPQITVEKKEEYDDDNLNNIFVNVDYDDNDQKEEEEEEEEEDGDFVDEEKKEEEDSSEDEDSSSDEEEYSFSAYHENRISSKSKNSDEYTSTHSVESPKHSKSSSKITKLSIRVLNDSNKIGKIQLE